MTKVKSLFQSVFFTVVDSGKLSLRLLQKSHHAVTGRSSKANLSPLSYTYTFAPVA